LHSLRTVGDRLHLDGLLLFLLAVSLLLALVVP